MAARKGLNFWSSVGFMVTSQQRFGRIERAGHMGVFSNKAFWSLSWIQQTVQKM